MRKLEIPPSSDGAPFAVGEGPPPPSSRAPGRRAGLPRSTERLVEASDAAPTSAKVVPFPRRVSAPEEDTQPLRTGPPDLSFDEVSSDGTEFEPPPPSVQPPSVQPRSRRNPSGEYEGRISREIPPPDHVEFEGGRPVDGKDPYLGTTFDKRYKIEQIIGEGGMGFVYLARHKVIDKKVAVKVLRNDMARDRENLDRFLQEARAASSIGNPHIVDISDFGDLPDGSTYFVMEYLDGGSLSRLIEEEKPLSSDRICHIALQLTDGLSAAHASGIVHRDLKPDNVILVPRGADEEFVKILDFGIAKVMSTAEKLTMAGAVFGTPHYMSPEQAAGNPVDHRTDVYSLGIMFYEMASGSLPFNADNFMAILSQHMYQAPTPIREVAPECSLGLEAVILKCLSKKPEARYQTMDELREDLEKLKNGEVPGAVAEMVNRADGFSVPPEYFKRSSASISPSVMPEPRRPWALYGAAVTAILVGVVAVIVAVRTVTNARSQPPPLPAVSTEPVPAPPPSPVITAPPEPTPAPAPQVPKKIAVGLAATPEAAVGIRDGKIMKLPATIELAEGQVVSVDIRAEGYEAQTVKLDGKEQIRMVKLNKLPSSLGPKTGPTGTAKELVNPFDPRYRDRPR
ncbi:MAG TPA: serine/threonine-protein kinase [Polyangiaceae bacterium]|nr:serine/threonine-protein kinase [Polyangiaceae bacterium]